MAEAQRFSHIKVSDADDDIVIQAGAVPAAKPASPTAPPTASASAPSPAVPATEPVPTPRSARPGAKRDSAYRETTLEDLESSKMGTAQKAVIVLAVLGIIAFAVWYCLLR